MAKRSFSAEAFNEAAGQVASGDSGEYPVISRGTYIANVAKVFFEIKDSGAEMVSFGFQIDSEDEDFPNQYVYVNENLVKKSGEENLRGIRQFVVLLNGLTDGHFHKPSFAQPDSRDSELEKLLGTRVKIHITPKPDGKYTNYKVEIRALLDNVYAKERNIQLDDTVDVDATDTPPKIATTVVDASSEAVGETKPIEKGIELQVGMKIILTTLVDGKPQPELGTCLQFIDTGDPETSMVMFDPDRKDRKPKAFKPDEVINCQIQMDDNGNAMWDKEFLKNQAKTKQAEAVAEAVAKRAAVAKTVAAASVTAAAVAAAPVSVTETVDIVTDEIEELEEEPEWELVVKGAAAFTNKGNRYSGLVISIDEDAGKAIIACNGKNLKVPISFLGKP